MSERGKVVVAMVREMEPEIAEAAKSFSTAMGQWRRIQEKMGVVLETAAPGGPEDKLALSLCKVCSRLSEAVCYVPDPFWAMMVASGVQAATEKHQQEVLGGECMAVGVPA